MNIKNQRPVFVPVDFQPEIERLSKAALMDMVWDYATRCAGVTATYDVVIDEFRKTREIVLTHRKQAKGAA